MIPGPVPFLDFWLCYVLAFGSTLATIQPLSAKRTRRVRGNMITTLLAARIHTHCSECTGYFGFSHPLLFVVREGRLSLCHPLIVLAALYRATDSIVQYALYDCNHVDNCSARMYACPQFRLPNVTVRCRGVPCGVLVPSDASCPAAFARLIASGDSPIETPRSRYT